MAAARPAALLLAALVAQRLRERNLLPAVVEEQRLPLQVLGQLLDELLIAQVLHVLLFALDAGVGHLHDLLAAEAWEHLRAIRLVELLHEFRRDRREAEVDERIADVALAVEVDRQIHEIVLLLVALVQSLHEHVSCVPVRDVAKHHRRVARSVHRGTVHAHGMQVPHQHGVDRGHGFGDHGARGRFLFLHQRVGALLEGLLLLVNGTPGPWGLAAFVRLCGSCFCGQRLQRLHHSNVALPLRSFVQLDELEKSGLLVVFALILRVVLHKHLLNDGLRRCLCLFLFALRHPLLLPATGLPTHHLGLSTHRLRGH
mmetsp:Transcript_60722/g.163535  ORF Transcript_60722/g.163535 Transcript_60722/m.163535 type:complete len:314 (+) Transcript_60722:607-1548(+)